MPLTLLFASAAFCTDPTFPTPGPDDPVAPTGRFVGQAATDYHFDPAAVALGASRDDALPQPPPDAGAGAPPGDPLDDAIDDAMADPRGRPDDADADADIWKVPGPPPFGQTGTSRWYLHLGRGWEFDESRNGLTVAGFGLSYFIDEGLSLDAELNGAIFNQSGTDSGGGNFNLLFRYHYIMKPSWSAYIDAGAGMLWTNERVPQGGSQFNFTPQAGLGLTFDIGYDLRLMTGVRWHHISNADLFDSNPGRDSFMVYLGVSVPY